MWHDARRILAFWRTLGCERWGLSAGLFQWRGKSALIGEGNRLGAVACVNLGEQVVDVALDGAVCVIIAWLAGWTILGAWRMMTRDA
jgi:hypothetical protein